VGSGKEASNLIKGDCFDVALIDVRLQDMLGTDLLCLIAETSPQTVKVVFTGSPDVDCRLEAERKHVDAFFIKPVNPQVLLKLLDEKLKRK
jgi:DNA-binding NtrC family response regulator